MHGWWIKKHILEFSSPETHTHCFGPRCFKLGGNYNILSKISEIRHCFALKVSNLGGKSSLEFVGTRLSIFCFVLFLFFGFSGGLFFGQLQVLYHSFWLHRGLVGSSTHKYLKHQLKIQDYQIRRRHNWRELVCSEVTVKWRPTTTHHQLLVLVLRGAKFFSNW